MDPIVAHLVRLERAAADLEAELRVLRGGLRATRRLREDGLALSEALSQSPEPANHEAVAARSEQLTEIAREYRTLIVRHLVDEEGWTLSDVAARTGNARQVVSRLYHAPAQCQRGTRPGPKFRLATSGLDRPALR